MQQTVIDASKWSVFPNLNELWRYRQLMYSLAWRDIRVKYAQTFVGLLWTIINPVFNLLILSFVFGKVAKVDTGGVPHLLFTVAGLSAWTYFSTLLSDAGNSIVGAQSMVKKIYFPRLIIPMSKALTGLVDFGVTLLILFALMIYYGVSPGPNIVWLPLFLFFALISGLAGGIIFSALSVRYRDFSYIIPMVVRVGLYATPVAYPVSAVPEKYKLLYFMNPLAGIVEGFRWSLFGVGDPQPYMFYSLGFIFILFIIGILFFQRIDRNIADII